MTERSFDPADVYIICQKSQKTNSQSITIIFSNFARYDRRTTRFHNGSKKCLVENQNKLSPFPYARYYSSFYLSFSLQQSLVWATGGIYDADVYRDTPLSEPMTLRIWCAHTTRIRFNSLPRGEWESPILPTFRSDGACGSR